MSAAPASAAAAGRPSARRGSGQRSRLERRHRRCREVQAQAGARGATAVWTGDRRHSAGCRWRGAAPPPAAAASAAAAPGRWVVRRARQSHLLQNGRRPLGCRPLGCQLIERRRSHRSSAAHRGIGAATAGRRPTAAAARGHLPHHLLAHDRIALRRRELAAGIQIPREDRRCRGRARVRQCASQHVRSLAGPHAVLSAQLVKPAIARGGAAVVLTIGARRALPRVAATAAVHADEALRPRGPAVQRAILSLVEFSGRHAFLVFLLRHCDCSLAPTLQRNSVLPCPSLLKFNALGAGYVAVEQPVASPLERRSGFPQRGGPCSSCSINRSS